MADSPEMKLIGDSVKSASARIRFFRIAFGATGDDTIRHSEVVSILTDMFAGVRLSVEWGPVDGQIRKAVRCAFLAIQCLETVMPYGGWISVSNSRAAWKVVGQSEQLSEIHPL